MAAMPIYGKTLKYLLLRNQDSFEAESWYILGESVYLVQLMVVALTFDLFMAR